MKETRIIMGMPVTLEVVDENVNQKILDEVFDYFVYIDEKFSTYKSTSEISAINRGEIDPDNFSEDMKVIFDLSKETKELTNGYFDIKRGTSRPVVEKLEESDLLMSKHSKSVRYLKLFLSSLVRSIKGYFSTPLLASQNKKDGSYDTSGMVKGWAIFKASQMLSDRGMKNFYINIAGDIQVSGHNALGAAWRVGIQNPFNKLQESVKTLYLKDEGVATSGTYVRGNHIYNPKNNHIEMEEIVSLTVIGPNIYEADRFATASFAMGKEGINFIEKLNGFEAYVIDKNGMATMTSGFNKYTNTISH